MDLMMLVVVGFWALCGIAAAITLSNKGRSGCGGFLLGFLLGPIGLALALVMKADQAVLDGQQIRSGAARTCPSCAEVVKIEAVKCKHCGADLPPVDAEEIEIRQRADTVEKGFIAALIMALSIMVVGWLFS